MKLPTIAKIRIPILQALAVGEAVGLYYFYGQPKFFQFVVASVLGVMFIVPLLFLPLPQAPQILCHDLALHTDAVGARMRALRPAKIQRRG